MHGLPHTDCPTRWPSPYHGYITHSAATGKAKPPKNCWKYFPFLFDWHTWKLAYDNALKYDNIQLQNTNVNNSLSRFSPHRQIRCHFLAKNKKQCLKQNVKLFSLPAQSKKPFKYQTRITERSAHNLIQIGYRHLIVQIPTALTHLKKKSKSWFIGSPHFF